MNEVKYYCYEHGKELEVKFEKNKDGNDICRVKSCVCCAVDNYEDGFKFGRDSEISQEYSDRKSYF